MTRNDSEQPTKHREPLNWPTVAFGVAALAAVVAVVWLVTNAAVKIWGS